MMDWLCALPVVAGLISGCGQPEPLAVGYVEGEYALLAPIATARLVDISVRRGERLEAGAVVAVQETRDAELAVGEARAAADRAEAQLTNLQEGKRPEEIAVIEASLRSSLAQADEAERQLQRQKNLSERGFASQSDFDSASTAVEMALAKVAELRANLAVARLPAREAEIAAASNQAQQSRAALQSAQWRLSERTIHAPANGQVADVILRRGEVAGPSAPVISFLPDGATRLKLYVPETGLAAIAPGTRLTVRCDGCGEGQHAVVSYVADAPEFTPPVIYSLNRRQKLVFLVEARPEGEARLLKPGQIVDVVLAEPAK